MKTRQTDCQARSCHENKDMVATTNYRLNLIIISVIVVAFLAACSNAIERQIEVTQSVKAEPNKSTISPTIGSISMPNQTIFALPERVGPRTQTSGVVPHVQLNVDPVDAVNDELFRRAYLQRRYWSGLPAI